MTKIPSPLSPGALSVTDGATTVGTVVVRDGSYFAFDAEGVLIGEYATQQKAMRAIPSEECAESLGVTFMV